MLDFDQILQQVGDFNAYQIILYIFICFPASFPCAWTAFNMVFTSATPPHWCKIPELEAALAAGANLTMEKIQELSIPWDYSAIENSKAPELSKCHQYDRNYSAWESIDVKKNATIIPCQYGWTYNRSTYRETVASQVTKNKKNANQPQHALYLISEFNVV